MVTNLTTPFLQIQSIFFASKKKKKDFCLQETLIQRKEVPYIQRVQQNFHQEHKSYIKLYVPSLTLCDLFSTISFILFGTNRNHWVAVNFQSPIIFSKDTSTLLLTFELYYKPLYIFQRVVKKKQVHHHIKVLEVFLIIQ